MIYHGMSLVYHVMSQTRNNSIAMSRDFVRPSDEELTRSLSAEQYAVTQQCGTEPPFRNAYWNNHEAGLYVDVVSGEPLFASIHKFDSGSGWPSFSQPVLPNVTEREDTSHGMRRIEVRSRSGDSHLGHLFPDGPREMGGMRYCVNSAALRFIPVADLEREGYGTLASLFDKQAASGAGGATGAGNISASEETDGRR